MPTVTITGGTGLIGTALRQALTAQGYNVIILSRNAQPASDKNTGQTTDQQVQFASWDPSKDQIDPVAIQNADYIIHLAGANVGEKRWTTKRKEEILRSRVQSGQLISRSLAEIPNQVKAVISASGIGWYGPDRPGKHWFHENDPAYDDFLGSTCVQWEDSIKKVKDAGKRLVIFRTGIVLSKDGGALKEFLKPLKAGIASILGNGRQVVSWIHIDDLVNLYIYSLQHEHISGVYNAVSSQPVSNRELVLSLARARNKFYIPVKVPSFVLKTVLGEMSIEVLKSATVGNKKIIDAGFVFTYDNIDAAMHEIMHKGHESVA
jgi:uncharacterized protein (TIGR01777 family)